MTDWYINPIKQIYRPEKVGRIKYKTDSRRLKFCEDCKMVWEKCHADNTHYRYKDFPTYGLTRKQCVFCK